MRSPSLLVLVLPLLSALPAGTLTEDEAAFVEATRRFDFDVKGLEGSPARNPAFTMYQVPGWRIYVSDKLGVKQVVSNGFSFSLTKEGEGRYFFPGRRSCVLDVKTGRISVPPGEGEAITSFDLENVAGGRVDLKSLRGKVVLLDFFASWCVPCRRTMPKTIALHKEYASKGLVVLGINIEGDATKARETAEKWEMDFPVLLDAPGEGGRTQWDSRTLRSLGIHSIPHCVLVDRKGIIRDRGVTLRDEGLVERLLEE